MFLTILRNNKFTKYYPIDSRYGVDVGCFRINNEVKEMIDKYLNCETSKEAKEKSLEHPEKIIIQEVKKLFPNTIKNPIVLIDNYSTLVNEAMLSIVRFKIKNELRDFTVIANGIVNLDNNDEINLLDSYYEALKNN